MVIFLAPGSMGMLPSACAGDAIAMEWRSLEHKDFVLSYPSLAFLTAIITVLPKKVANDNDLPIELEPQRWSISFSHPSRGNTKAKEISATTDSSLSNSFIYITPLADSSVPDFAKAYPWLSGSASDFRKIFNGRKNFEPWLSLADKPKIP